MTVEDELEKIQAALKEATQALDKLIDAKATENIKSEAQDKAFGTLTESLGNIAFALREIRLLKNLKLP